MWYNLYTFELYFCEVKKMGKVCKNCGMENDDEANFCEACGGNEFKENAVAFDPTEIHKEAPKPVESDKSGLNGEFVSEKTSINPTVDEQTTKQITKENFVLGFIGALLFSLIGAVLYFAVYQIGVIAAVCGLAIFLLANFGYVKFSKSGTLTTKGIVVSAVITLIMIFFSEYFCLSFEIYKVYKNEYDINIFDAIGVTSSFLNDSNVLSGFIKDLAIAYIISIVAIVSEIVKRRKAA